MRSMDTTRFNDRELAIYNELFQIITGLKQRINDLEETVAAKQKIINNLADDVDNKINKAMRCNSGQRVIRKQIVEDNDTWMV